MTSSSRMPELEITREQRMLIRALSDLISQHCPDCLLGITLLRPLTTLKLVVHSAETQTAKYAIRDPYVRDILGLPFENVSGKYCFHIKLNDLAKNEIIQKKIQQLHQKDIKAVASLEKTKQELTGEKLTLSDKKKIAAFLNVFFAPFGKEVWKVDYYENVIALFVNDRYLLPDNKSFDSFDVAQSITEYFSVSNIADELGFTQVLLDEMRTTLQREPHKRIHCYYFDVETVLPICLVLIKKLEKLVEKEIQVDTESKNDNDGYFVKKETAQIREMIASLCKDRDYQINLKTILLESLPFSSDLIGVPIEYARMFKGSLPIAVKTDEYVGAKITPSKS